MEEDELKGEELKAKGDKAVMKFDKEQEQTEMNAKNVASELNALSQKNE